MIKRTYFISYHKYENNKQTSWGNFTATFRSWLPPKPEEVLARAEKFGLEYWNPYDRVHIISINRI